MVAEENMEPPEIAKIARNYAVMVRIQGPDPKGLKMRRHPFHHHQDGITTLSASGVFLPATVSETLHVIERIRQDGSFRSKPRAVVVTVASAVEPFLLARRNAIEESTPAQVFFPKLIPEAHVDILIDQRDKEGCSLDKLNLDSCWLKTQLLALIEVPAAASALKSLVSSRGSPGNSSWDVGWSLAPSNNGSQFTKDIVGDEVPLDLPSASSYKDISTTRIALLEVLITDPRDLPHANISKSQKGGDLLVAMGSPFGILSPLHFFNSISVGAVANCCPAGSSYSSLLIADIRCLPGMEGAPIFDKNASIAGILIRPLRQKGFSSEIQLMITWSAIESACTLQSKELLIDSGENHGKKNFHGMQSMNVNETRSIQHLPGYPPSIYDLQSPVERTIASVVLVTVGDGAWATGIILNKDGLILTNAHLLEPWRYGRTSLLSVTNESSVPIMSSGRSTEQITIQEHDGTSPPSALLKSGNRIVNDAPKSMDKLTYRSYQTLRVRLNHSKPWMWSDAKVIYISKGPMDIALLELEYIPDELFPVSVDHVPPTPGSRVHVIGHGPFGPRSDVYPYVSSGVISRVIKGPRSLPLFRHSSMLESGGSLSIMLETTAAVYPGMSGGAVVNSDGHMVGLITSNAKHGGGIIIPEMNFSIPCVALEPVFKFSVDKDLSKLLVFDGPDTFLSSVWALRSPLSSDPQPPFEQKKEGKGSRFAEFLAKRQAENVSSRDQGLFIRGKRPSDKLIKSKM